MQLAERLATLTDLDFILEAVADAVMRAVAPAACAIDLFDEEGNDLAVSLTRGLEEPVADWWAQIGVKAYSVPLQPTLLQASWPAELEAINPPAMLRIPLALPGRAPVGALTLFASRPEALPATDLPTLRNIVIQAASAITASRARLREVLAVYTVAQSITGRIQLPQLAGSVLRAVANLFGVEHGAVVLTETSRSTGAGLQVVTQLGSGLTSAAAEAVMEPCAARTSPFVLEELRPLAVVGAGLEGIALVAPLRLERKLLGAMVLIYPASRRFRQSDLWLLSAIASQVTMALRNAQLYLWSEELAIAEERSRIAREIHDGLAQSLAHKILKLDLCLKLIGRDHDRLRSEIETIKESVRADIQDVRHSILTLRPLDLEQRGLQGAVDAYVEQFSRDTGIVTACRIGSLESISPKAQTALFRLMQEALNNIRKHAQATNARVIINVDAAGEIKLEVSDNGRGFDVNAALQRQPGQTGIGLRGMIERAVGADGTIQIDSEPGAGTRIEVCLPSR